MKHSLILKTEYSTETVLELRKSDEVYDIEAILDSTKKVYSEVHYKAELEGFDDYASVKMRLNDDETEIYREKNSILFLENEGRVFKEYLGFARFTVIAEKKDGVLEYWHSDHITIMVREQGLNNLVNDMLRYIFDNKNDLLLRNTSVAGSITQESTREKKDLLSILVMMEHITNTYENYYSFFKVNSSYQIRQEDTVDRVERLQHVDSRTIQFIVSHPEYLRESATGIRVGRQFYQPQKTLMSQNVFTYDIPENRVVVSFLQYMVHEAELLMERVRQLYRNQELPEETEDGYIISSYLMYVSAYEKLKLVYDRVENIKTQLESLFIRYQNSLQVRLIDGSQIPQASHIFHSILQYNHIYRCILQWHTHSGYEFVKEQMMMSFYDSSSVYEFYVMTKLMENIEEAGFENILADRFEYPISANSRFVSKDCNNIFVYRKGDARVTLYYEPVIGCKDTRELNGLGLYRNNTHSLLGEAEGIGYGEYYTPDYVLKYEDGEHVKYFICDAKFCGKEQVLKKHMQQLVYKYLFSISTVDAEEQIAGLYVFYGKAYSGAKIESFYNRQIQMITPAAEIIPLNEKVELKMPVTMQQQEYSVK